MKLLLKLLFWISSFTIFWAMFGYPLSLFLLNKMFRPKPNSRDFTYQPSVTLLIVAHNEEKVIKGKLENAISLNYPKEKLEIVVTSDNSTDQTNQIINSFISSHPDFKIRLYIVKKRLGKTNAQNEAVKTISSEIIVMTDANSILERNSIKELVSSFVSEDIAYVTGRLKYLNVADSETSKSEATYWDLDLKLREIESKFHSVTAGNGALYACKREDYHDFDPIQSHDSAMPVFYALNGRRAIANHNAVAFEKAGANIGDEFNRKVRMNRLILKQILPNIKILNFFKMKWFTYFYLGHRTSRYLLWISHIILLFSSFFIIDDSLFYLVALIGQLSFYLFAAMYHFDLLKTKFNRMMYYYSISLISQLIGAYKYVTGQSKPTWEKAESTR